MEKQDAARAEEDRQQQQKEGGHQQPAEIVVATAVASGSAQQQQIQQQPQEADFSVDDLHNNDTRILALLNEEEGSNYSFKGIQRRLGIHQQSLARALNRLREMGLVERSKIGYHLSRAGASVTATPLKPNANNREYIQLLQTYIPAAGIRPAEVTRPLVGRWFKGLRWVGLIESGTGFTLRWASEDGSFQINLRMVADYVIVETNAAGERDKLRAMACSYAVFEQITKVLQEKISSFSSSTPSNAYVFGGHLGSASAVNN